MGAARKCDRCKVCFDPMEQERGIEMTRFRNPLFQTLESIEDGAVSRFLIEDAPDYWVDLCPACTKLFCQFMANNNINNKGVTTKDEKNSDYNNDNYDFIGDILRKCGLFGNDDSLRNSESP